MFSPGELVVCVDDEDRPWFYRPHAELVGDLDGLRKGSIYTVRDVVIWDTTTVKAPFVGLRLEEIVRRPEGDDPSEPPFIASRFRPVSRKASELFASLLEPNQKTLAKHVVEANQE